MADMPDFRSMTDEQLRAWTPQAMAAQPTTNAVPDFRSMTDEQLKAWKPSAAPSGEIVKMRGQESESPALGTASAASGNFIGGIPVVGPILKGGAERAAAGIRSVIHGSSYDDELKNVQGYAKRTTEANPITSTVAGVGGAVAGTIPMVMAAPAAFGAGTGGLLSRTAASTLSGTGLGGADAAARSGGDLKATQNGALLGGILGVAGPAAGQMIGKGASWAVDKTFGISSPTGPIAGIPKKAAAFAANTFDDPARAAALRTEMNRLGPNAMLADVSPEWMGVARGAASRPQARENIAQALLSRDAGKNTRLAADLNANLGRAVVPSQIDDGLRAGQQALSPQYQRTLQNARAVDTQALAHALDAEVINSRGPAQQAAGSVRKMLNVVGAPDQLDPNPQTLLQTRHAIDGLMQTNADTNVARVLGSARNQVDDVLGRAVPGIKDVDAQFQELARQRGGLMRGQQVLGSGPTSPRPQELAQEFAEGVRPQGTMVGPSATPMRMQQGARAEIDRVVGTNANDPVSLQRLLKSEGDWNRDRLRTLFGPDRADNALNAVDREALFNRTAGRVTAGSDTAMAQRFGNFLDAAATPNSVPTDLSVLGAAFRGIQKGGQKLLGSNAEANAQRFADALGRVSVATGTERDQLVDALMGLAKRRQSLKPINEGAQSLARALLAATPPAANQRLTSPTR
ncbi:MAG: hypothetical protein Q8M24_14720 [Pseudolabrys sp.]|nr:hypothetical protein [Pseudolabrys sp.]